QMRDSGPRVRGWAAPRRDARGGSHRTGTATVTVNLILRTLGISATFDNATYDLGVNLGPVGTVTATSVALSNIDLGTGASFVLPMANASNSFDAAGDVACPSGGCLAPASGPYGFGLLLRTVSVSLPPSGNVSTFDGSATCPTAAGILSCTGPFVLNAFPVDTIAMGPAVTIDRMVSFRDPALAATRGFNARIILTNVTTSGSLDIAGLSRYRGAIPARYATTGGGVPALFFDGRSNATFASARGARRVG